MYISPTLAALVYIRNTAVRCLWPRSNYTVFLWRSQSLAPSARGGSERLAPAKSIAAETPNQKSGGSKDEPIQWKSMDATKSRIITTTAPEQTTSEPRPATTASATWSWRQRAPNNLRYSSRCLEVEFYEETSPRCLRPIARPTLSGGCAAGSCARRWDNITYRSASGTSRNR